MKLYHISNMIRPLRIEFERAVYYIISRRNAKQEIFLEKAELLKISRGKIKSDITESQNTSFLAHSRSSESWATIDIICRFSSSVDLRADIKYLFMRPTFLIRNQKAVQNGYLYFIFQYIRLKKV